MAKARQWAVGTHYSVQSFHRNVDQRLAFDSRGTAASDSEFISPAIQSRKGITTRRRAFVPRDRQRSRCTRQEQEKVHRLFSPVLVSFLPAWSATSLSLPAAIGACLEDAYSNAGGGGERVLWTAVALMQRTEPDVISVVYSGDTDASKEQIVAKAKVRARASPCCSNAPRTNCPYTPVCA